VELLFAIFILGVGLAMGAALFPAGIIANRDSDRDLRGMLICQNGLAIAKARLTHGDVTDDTDLVPHTRFADTDAIPDEDFQYPAGSGSKRGFLLLARRMAPNENDYQLVIVSYDKTNAGHTAEALRVNCTISGGEGKFPVSLIGGEANPSQLIGSPALTVDARYARITGIEFDADAGEDVFVLDRPVDSAEVNVSYVIVERDLPGGSIVGTRSPAMAVLVARTALSP